MSKDEIDARPATGILTSGRQVFLYKILKNIDFFYFISIRIPLFLLEIILRFFILLLMSFLYLFQGSPELSGE